MFSIIFEGTLVREIGRQLRGEHLLSFLNIGMIFPVRQSSGTIPVASDRETIRIMLEITLVVFNTLESQHVNINRRR